MAAPPARFEVEVKLRLDGDAVARGRLAACGARPGPVEAQDDVFFAHPQRDFARTDEALRLRRVGDRCTLTYKGPRQAGSAKTRVEHDVEVTAAMVAVLEALGFRQAARLHKRREAFHLGDVEVALDHLDGLGWFLEVEVTGPDRAAAEAKVEAAVARLAVPGDRVAASYLELALKAGARSASLA